MYIVIKCYQNSKIPWKKLTFTGIKVRLLSPATCPSDIISALFWLVPNNKLKFVVQEISLVFTNAHIKTHAVSLTHVYESIILHASQNNNNNNNDWSHTDVFLTVIVHRRVKKNRKHQRECCAFFIFAHRLQSVVCDRHMRCGSACCGISNADKWVRGVIGSHLLNLFAGWE